MSQSKQKVVQYLNEAHATEVALVRVLQSQIGMTPRGSYRSGLEKHLGETRDHARRVQRRLAELGAGSNPAQAVVGFVESAIGQTLALWKTPLDLLRGDGGEEKVLRTPRTPAQPRRSRSRPTSPSSGSRTPSGTRRPPGWRLPSAAMRSGCSSASSASSRSSPRPWSAPRSRTSRP